jgi:hypothetical protein
MWSFPSGNRHSESSLGLAGGHRIEPEDGFKAYQFESLSHPRGAQPRGCKCSEVNSGCMGCPG